MCPPEEFDQMISAFKKDLPASFRVTGFRSQAFAVRDLIEGKKQNEIFCNFTNYFLQKYILFFIYILKEHILRHWQTLQVKDHLKLMED